MKVNLNNTTLIFRTKGVSEEVEQLFAEHYASKATKENKKALQSFLDSVGALRNKFFYFTLPIFSSSVDEAMYDNVSHSVVNQSKSPNFKLIDGGLCSASDATGWSGMTFDFTEHTYLNSSALFAAKKNVATKVSIFETSMNKSANGAWANGYGNVQNEGVEFGIRYDGERIICLSKDNLWGTSIEKSGQIKNQYIYGDASNTNGGPCVMILANGLSDSECQTVLAAINALVKQ